MSAQRLFCFGHRGARGHAPENTLRSVRTALELGADGIEVDVYRVGDELVVIHDDTLERTTNGQGRVMDQSFAQLRSLDAGDGERIPTLQEVFDTVNHRALINVELKGPGTAAPVATLISHYVREQGWRHDEFLVSSFDHSQLQDAKRMEPELRIGALILRAPRDLGELAGRLGAWSLHPSKRCTSEKLVTGAHRCGLKVFVFTVNTPGEIARCEALGVDGVFSDYPERVTVRSRDRLI